MSVALEFPVIVFIWLALLVPSLGAFVRRMHDTDRSGAWWLLSLVPFGAIALFVFLCRSGDPDVNSYGPPPAVDPGA